MFRVKICGVTRAEDVQACIAAGVDAIGLNFYAASSRYVPPENAERLRAMIPATVSVVGVFVNESPAKIHELTSRLALDWVQLHGDEPPEFLPALAGCSILRAFRVGELGVRPIRDYLARCEALKCLPQAILLDAFSASGYGGTGERIDSSAVQQVRETWPNLPIVLAGGLNPENVVEAIQTAQPNAVDTASGVESTPGVKDAVKIRAFVTNAKISFADLIEHA